MGGSSKSKSTTSSTQADNRSLAEDGGVALSSLGDAALSFDDHSLATESGIAVSGGSGSVITIDQVPEALIDGAIGLLRDQRRADQDIFDSAIARSEDAEGRATKRFLMASVAVVAIGAAAYAWRASK